MKWQLPPEEKKFRDVGKLKIPDFGKKEEGPHTKDVGKLQWGGVSFVIAGGSLKLLNLLIKSQIFGRSIIDVLRSAS